VTLPGLVVEVAAASVEAAAVAERASVKKVLEHLGLPTTGPPMAKARSRVEFDFAS
jgi:hypothetical protein